MSDLRPVALTFSLLALLACGGRDTQPPPTGPSTLDAEMAEDTSATFLELESDLATPEDLPRTATAMDAFTVVMPPLPACVTRQELSPTSVKLTYTACSGPHGGTVNGVVIVSWNTEHTQWSRTFQNLVMARNGKSWTLNGTRTITVDREAKRSTVNVQDFHKTWKDGTTTREFIYACRLTADWATQGTYKLWGTFSNTLAGEPPLQGTIAAATPLTWERGCCHPVAGTLALTRGDKQATLVFGPRCGVVRIDGVPKELHPCGQGR